MKRAFCFPAGFPHRDENFVPSPHCLFEYQTLKPVLAVAALAAFCACAAAAPLSSRQHFIMHTAPVAIPLFEIPLDPELNAPAMGAYALPGFRPERIVASPQAPARPALVPALMSSLTLLGFGVVLIVSRWNLRRIEGRHGARRYVTRPMAYL